MLEFHDVKVYDLKETVIASRNAMRLEMPENTEEEFQKGLERAKKLATCGCGSGHSSFRKGIRVNLTMKYTQYITKQFQRYSHYDYISSSSLMHRITKMNFSNCCNKYVSQETVNKMNALVATYNKMSESTNLNMKRDYNLRSGEVIHALNRKDCLYYQFMTIISECPMGTELFVRVATNYEQLATIAKQRRGHKLREDYKAFFDMVRALPYAKELIPEAFFEEEV